MTTPSAVAACSIRPQPCAICSGPVLVVEHVGTGDVEGLCQCGDRERGLPVAAVIRTLRLVPEEPADGPDP